MTVVARAAKDAGSHLVAAPLPPSPCSARRCPAPLPAPAMPRLQKPHVESHCDAIGHSAPEQNSVAQLNTPVESIAAQRCCPMVSAQSCCGRASSATPSKSAPVQLLVSRSSPRTAKAAAAGMARQRAAASSRTVARPDPIAKGSEALAVQAPHGEGRSDWLFRMCVGVGTVVGAISRIEELR